MPYVIALVMSLFLSACSEDPIDKIKNLIDTALDDYLSEVAGEAAEAGGAATAVVAGVEAVLEISDTESPLFGTRIVIPADGLPAGITAAVLSVVPATVTAPDDFGLVGPAVDIALRDLSEAHADVTLAVAATLTLPYDAQALVPLNADEADAAISHYTGSQWQSLDTNDRSADRATGETVSFSPFVVMVAYQPTELEQSTNSYSFAVAQAGETICSGELDLDDATVQTRLTYMYHISGLYHADVLIQQEVGNVLEDRYNTFSEYADTLLDLPLDTVDAEAAAEWVDLSVYCDDLRIFNWNGEGITNRDVTFSGWETTMTTEGLCGVAQEPCTIHKGKVRVQAELAYTDSNDTSFSATASLDVAIDDATWEIMP